MKILFHKTVTVLFILAGFLMVGGSLVAVNGGQVVQADTISEIRDGVTGSGGGGSKNEGKQVAVIVRTVVNILLFFIGAFAVIILVVAGFRFVGANGDANTVSSAKNTIIYSVIGIVVAFMAFALTNFVIDQLTKSTAPPTCTSPGVPNPCTPPSPMP